MPNCAVNSFSALHGIINFISCSLVGYIVPMLFALAVAAFIWGIVQTLLNPTNEEARKKGKTFVMWGLISLFFMVAVWGIVKILAATFGLNTFIPQLSILSFIPGYMV